MTTSNFAFFFEEGAGYLFVSNIGTPHANGELQLVRCVADGRLYIRTSCNEVSLYRQHPNIPKLIDWADEDYHENDRRQCSTASIWEYCNGGDLAELLAKAEETGTALIEAFLWKLLLGLSTSLDFLHFGCQPAICHKDFHSGNIFLHWEDDSSVLPEVKLGDFGNARTYPYRIAGVDFSRLNNLLADIMKQARPRPPATPYSQELMSAIQSANDFDRQLSLSGVGLAGFTGGYRPVRTHLTSLLELTRQHYQHALTRMSFQDRVCMLRLKPDTDASIPMCDSPEALFDTEQYDERGHPPGPFKIVEVDADSYEVTRVIVDAGIEAEILPFSPYTYERVEDELRGSAFSESDDALL